MQEKPDQRSYILNVLARTGWNQSELAKRAGLDPSTLSRFLSSPQGSQSLRPATLRRIAQVTGLAFGEEPVSTAPASGGFSEGEAQLVADDAPELVNTVLEALRSGGRPVDAWQLQSRALELAGYRPGDTLFVELGAQALKGDVVCAQIYDWTANRTQTLFRMFEPPYLVSATQDIALLRPFSLQDEHVLVKGVVLHALRSKS
jgi:transcriptional regulator with XRE-family HTH domain